MCRAKACTSAAARQLTAGGTTGASPLKADCAAARSSCYDYQEYSAPEAGGRGLRGDVERIVEDAFYKFHHEARVYRERTAGSPDFSQSPNPRRILTADTARSGELLI